MVRKDQKSKRTKSTFLAWKDQASKRTKSALLVRNAKVLAYHKFYLGKKKKNLKILILN